MNEWYNRYSNIETVVGGGFYSLRKTKLGSKLVKTDRSPIGKLNAIDLKPSVGHNPRRQYLLNKRNLIQTKLKG